MVMRLLAVSEPAARGWVTFPPTAGGSSHLASHQREDRQEGCDESSASQKVGLRYQGLHGVRHLGRTTVSLYNSRAAQAQSSP